MVVNVGRGWSATVISVVGTVVLHAMTGYAAVAASPTANVTLTTCTKMLLLHTAVLFPFTTIATTSTLTRVSISTFATC